MPSFVQAEYVRQFVKDNFANLGAHAADEVQESLLIRGGFFCGRKFQLDGFSAVWFVEESQVKFYDRDGKLLNVLRPATPAQHQPQLHHQHQELRRAA